MKITLTHYSAVKFLKGTQFLQGCIHDFFFFWKEYVLIKYLILVV